jgi:hypothetical protein
MAKNKMGRPRLAKKEALGEVFGVRLRPDEARDVRNSIRESGESKPQWLRDALLTKARLRQRNGDGAPGLSPAKRSAV